MNSSQSRRLVFTSNKANNLRTPRGTVTRVIWVLDAHSMLTRPPDGEISIVFLTLRAMARLHDRFLGDPSPTDVITFPGSDADGMAGEICICPEMAYHRALELGVSFHEELTLYIVHGWLHLAGLDDRTTDQRVRMRRAEAVHMEALRRAKAVPTFRFVGTRQHPAV